jgi:hypothetical protein
LQSQIGSEVLIDDGLISMTVVSKTDKSVTCKVANNGMLGQVCVCEREEREREKEKQKEREREREREKEKQRKRNRERERERKKEREREDLCVFECVCVLVCVCFSLIWVRFNKLGECARWPTTASSAWQRPHTV